jgi:hypothetical protein
MTNNRPKTIFCDIDGVLLHHHNNGLLGQVESSNAVLLDGVYEKINEWDSKGYNIILTTGRRESHRKQTEKQLGLLGVFYDHLIMGIGGGDRIIINDRKFNSDKDTAFAINIERNKGIKNVEL